MIKIVLNRIIIYKKKAILTFNTNNVWNYAQIKLDLRKLEESQTKFFLLNFSLKQFKQHYSLHKLKKVLLFNVIFHFLMALTHVYL